MLLSKLRAIELKHGQKRPIPKGRMMVYYGWAKIGKIRRKEAISVIYENYPGAGTHHRFGKTIAKFQNTVYEREQTDKEMEDAAFSNRMFSEYSIFLDDRHIHGSLTAALRANNDADKNNVPKEIRDNIESSLRKFFMEQHPNYKEKPWQMEIEFK